MPLSGSSPPVPERESARRQNGKDGREDELTFCINFDLAPDGRAGQERFADAGYDADILGYRRQTAGDELLSGAISPARSMFSGRQSPGPSDFGNDDDDEVLNDYEASDSGSDISLTQRKEPDDD
eukprot:Hpha_TRINITY_DN9564_c0_g1::TRINITY_DN9564_c0_g1_i1::g.114880::m.114880